MEAWETKPSVDPNSLFVIANKSGYMRHRIAFTHSQIPHQRNENIQEPLQKLNIQCDINLKVERLAFTTKPKSPKDLIWLLT